MRSLEYIRILQTIVDLIEERIAAWYTLLLTRDRKLRRSGYLKAVRDGGPNILTGLPIPSWLIVFEAWPFRRTALGCSGGYEGAFFRR